MFRTSCVHHQKDHLYCTHSFLWSVFHAFVSNGLPDDEKMMFETFRKHQAVN